MSTNLACIFQILNQKKEEKLIETYALTQTTLEQIFVQLAGKDEDLIDDQQQEQTTQPYNNNNNNKEQRKSSKSSNSIESYSIIVTQF